MIHHSQPDKVWINVGAVDEEGMDEDGRHSLRAQCHIFGKQRVGWYDIEVDGIPVWDVWSE